MGFTYLSGSSIRRNKNINASFTNMSKTLKTSTLSRICYPGVPPAPLAIDPSFVPKNHTITFIPGDIFIPELKTVSAMMEEVTPLKWYCKRMVELRKSQKLVILPRKPFLPSIQGHHLKVVCGPHRPPTSQGENFILMHSSATLQTVLHVIVTSNTVLFALLYIPALHNPYSISSSQTE